MSEEDLSARSIDLGGSFSLGYFALGWIRIYMGNFNEAIDALLRCLRFSPNDIQAAGFMGQLALAQFHLENYEEAVRGVEQARRRRYFPFFLRVQIAGLGQLGRTGEAASVIAELRALKTPDATRYWKATSLYVDPQHRAHIFDGLHKAGMSQEEAALVAG